MFYEDTYRIQARDADIRNLCRPSALLYYLQEAATQAAGELGASRDQIVEKYNCFWMLARMWYRLDEPLYWDEKLTVRTWHRGGTGAAMYRDFDLYREGRQIGEAVSVWVLADLDTHKLKKLREIGEFHLTDGGVLCKDIKLHKVIMPAGLTEGERRRMHYSDTDVNGHVNNVRYADFACDALEEQLLSGGGYVSSMHLSYLNECRAGEELTLWTAQQEGANFVRGADSQGTARFEACVLVKNTP